MLTPRALLRSLFALAASASSTPAWAQTTTLQLDNGTMEQMWSLTSPNAGPGDWVGVAYTPPIEHPFRVVSATMFFLDSFCCSATTGVCSSAPASCPNVTDWDRRIIAPANLAVDAAGLTPDISAFVVRQIGVAFAGPGATFSSPPWTLTPDVWTLPAGTIFDAPGRVFYAIKYISGDQWMRFAVDNDGPAPTSGIGIHTSDNFTSRASIWSFGNVGMRIAVEPVFFLKLASPGPAASYQLAGTTGVTMLSLGVRAGNAPTTITQFRVRASGTGNDQTAISAVRLVVDTNQDGVASAGEPTIATGTYAANDGLVTLTPSRTLATGAREQWLVVYDFNLTPAGGDTFAARIAASTDVTANLGAPYMSGTVGGTGALLGPTVTVAGRLAVSRGPASLTSQVVPAGIQNLATLQVRLTSDNEAFNVSGLAITADGTLNEPTEVTSVRLYLDADGSGTVTAGDTNLQAQTFGANDGVVAFTFAPVTVPRNASRDFIVVYDLAAGAVGGRTFRSILASATDVAASGQSSGPIPTTGPRALTGAPVIGNLATVGGALTAALGAATSGAGTAQPGATNVPMLQVTLTAQAEAVSISRLTFSASGTGDDSTQVARVRLYRDVNQNGVADAADAAVSLPQTYATNDGVVTFSLAAETVPAGGSRTYLVTYDFSATPTGGEAFRARLVAAADLGAAGQASGAPITASGTFPLNGAFVTMLGGLSFTLGPQTPPARNVQPGSSDVAVLQVRAAAQGETFQVSSLRLTAAGSLLDDTQVMAVRLWRDAGTLGVRDGADVALGNTVYAADDGTAQFTFATPIALAPGANEQWLVTYDLGLAVSPGQTFRASVASAADIVATGNLSGVASVQGLPATGNVLAIGGTLVLSPGPANPAGGSLDRAGTSAPMLQVRLAAQLEPITVNGVTLTAAGSGHDVNAISAVRLYVDTNADGVIDPVGDLPLGAPATFAQNDGTLTLTFPGRTIAAGASEVWLAAYDLSGTAVAGDTFQLSIASDTQVTSSAPSGPVPRTSGAPVAGGARTVLGRLAIARGAQTPPARTVARNVIDAPVLQLELTGNGETFTISTLTFHAAGSVDDVGDVLGVTLLLDADNSGTRTAGDIVLGARRAITGDDGVASFSGLALSVPAAGAARILVVADFTGTAVGGSTFRLSLPTAADVAATGLGGRIVTSPSGPPVGSNTLTMGGTLDVGLGLASPIARVVLPGSVGVSALQLRLVAASEGVTVTRLALHASGSGNDATGIANVALYLDGDGNGLVGPGEPQLGIGTFSADDGTINFPLSLGVQVGPAVRLLAVVSMTQSPIGGDTFRLSLDPGTDVAITSGSGAVVITGAPLSGALLTAGGGFEVALGPLSGAGSLVNQARQNVPVIQLDLRAVNEACVVNGLTLRASGSIDDLADLSAVRLLRDVNDNGLVDFNDVAVGVPSTFNRDDGAVTFTGLARSLGTNVSERLLVVYDLAGTASNLETFRVRLEDDADVNVTCNVSGPLLPTGAPIEGAIFTIQEDGALILSRGAESPPSLFIADGTVRAGVFQLRVAASVQPLTLDALVLTASVSAGSPPNTVATISVFRDVNQDGLLDRTDTLLAPGAAPNSAGRVTFTGLGLTVPVNEAQFLLAAVDVARGADPGTRFQLGVDADADATATSAFGAALTTGAPVFGRVMTVAGNLNLLLGAPGAPRVVHNDETDLVALSFGVSAVWEVFRLRTLTVTAEGTMDPASAVSGLSLWSDQNADGVLDAGDLLIAEGIAFPEGARRASFLGLDEAVEPGRDRRFLLVMDLDGRARVNEAIALRIAANVDVAAQGARVGLASPIGAPLAGGTFTVGRSLEVATGPAAPVDAIVAANSKHVPALQIAVAAFNEDVTLSRLTLSLSGTLEDSVGLDAVRLLRDVDGGGQVDPGDVLVAEPARPSANDGTVSFGPLAERIPKNGSAIYLASLDLSGAGEAGQDVRLSLLRDADISAFGSLSGAVAAAGAPVEGPRISLVGALNVRIGNASPPGVGVPPGATFPALQLELFTRGERVSIEQLQLRVTGTADDASALAMTRLWRDRDGDGAVGGADEILANARPDGDDGLLIFLSLGLDLAGNANEKLLVELELAEGAAAGGTLRLALEENGHVRATGAVSGAITTVGAPLVGSQFTIVAPSNRDRGEPVAEGCGCSSAAEGDGSAGWWIFGGLAFGIAWRRRRF